LLFSVQLGGSTTVPLNFTSVAPLSTARQLKLTLTVAIASSHAKFLKRISTPYQPRGTRFAVTVQRAAAQPKVTSGRPP